MKKTKKMHYQKVFKEAGKQLIEKIRRSNTMGQHDDIDLSWKLLNRKYISSRRKRIQKYTISTAVSVAAVIVVIFLVFNHTPKFVFFTSVLSNSDIFRDSLLYQKEIILISNGKQIELANGTTIEYNDNKANEIDPEMYTSKTAEVKYDQLVVPHGRRANIVFQDGTHMYINSGSHVTYPTLFDRKKRELFIYEGEIFLEVAKEIDRPFIVSTQNFSVNVLGTSFNVCTYKEDKSAQVTLVEGSVQVILSNANKVQVLPDQCMNIDGIEYSIKNVNVLEYMAWKDDYLYLEKQTCGNVLTRLSRYYDAKIVFDGNISIIPVKGKLNLENSLQEVLDVLCLSLDLKYEQDTTGLLIVSKKKH